MILKPLVPKYVAILIDTDGKLINKFIKKQTVTLKFLWINERITGKNVIIEFLHSNLNIYRMCTIMKKQKQSLEYLEQGGCFENNTFVIIVVKLRCVSSISRYYILIVHAAVLTSNFIVLLLFSPTAFV